MPLFLPGPGPWVNPSTEIGVSVAEVVASQVDAASLDRAGDRALGAVTVSPSSLPSALDHARGLGSLTVSATFPETGVIRAPKARAPLPKRPQRSQSISFQTATITPTGQVHTRAIGSPLVNPTATPTGLSHTRAQGDPVTTFVLPVPTVYRVVQPKRSGRTVAVSQIISGLTPLGAVTLSPASLSHTRAQGTPVVSPQALPSGQTHTRALGGPLVNATLVPSGLSHTRALGDPTVTAVFGIPTVLRVVQPRLAGRTIQGSQIVSGLTPTVPSGVAPSGLEHTRALGDPNVAVLALPTVHRVVQPRRTGRTVAVSQIVAGFAPAPPPPVAEPASLVHTRALGLPWTIPSDAGVAPHVVFAGAARGVIRALRPRKRLPEYTSAAEALAYAEEVTQPAPASLTRTRALGSITVQRVTVRQLGNPTVSVAWIERPSGLAHTRAQGSITVIGRKVEPSSLTRTRVQGTPTLSGRVILTGIAHVRATSSPSVNPRTASPASLSRTRLMGSHVVTLVKISRPESLTHSTRALGTPTARGKMEIGPPSLSRTRAQGTPVLSGRVEPVGLLNLRVLGDPAVNVRTLVPVALDRA